MILEEWEEQDKKELEWEKELLSGKDVYAKHTRDQLILELLADRERIDELDCELEKAYKTINGFYKKYLDRLIKCVPSHLKVIVPTKDELDAIDDLDEVYAYVKKLDTNGPYLCVLKETPLLEPLPDDPGFELE
jgi:hypothetical protein